MSVLIEQLSDRQSQRINAEERKRAEQERLYPIIARRADDPEDTDAAMMEEILTSLSITPRELIADIKSLDQIAELESQRAGWQAEVDANNVAIREAELQYEKVSKPITTHEGRTIRDIEGINRAQSQLAAARNAQWGGEQWAARGTGIRVVDSTRGPAWHLDNLQQKIAAVRAAHPRMFR